MLTVDLWSQDVLHGTTGRIVVGACILALVVPARWLLRRATLWGIRVWPAQRDNGPGKTMAVALIPPIQFIPVVVAVLLVMALIGPGAPMAPMFAELRRSLFAILVLWALYQAMGPLFSELYGRAQLFSHAMINWTVRAGKIVILAVGVSIVLDIWGFHIGPILTGLGLFGVAAGLGAQDVVKNLIAGMFIIGEKRFKNGDWIHAEQIVDGVVENVGLRASKVRRWDMAPAYVPNSKLSDNAVTNFGQMAYRKISWVVGLDYRTTAAQLQQVRDNIEACILGNEDFAHPPDAPWTFVRVDGFADSSINLMVYCFSRSTDWGEWLKVKEALVYAIKRIVEEAGTDFAFPSRTLYVETMPSGAEASASPPRQP